MKKTNQKLPELNRKYIMEHKCESERLIRKVNIPRFINKYLKKHLNNSQKILDVGCGPGHISAQIANMYSGIEVTGVDISEQRINDGIEYFNYHKNLTLISGDAQELPFKNNSFDFVFSRFMLEYVKDPRKAVNEMVRVCKNGGQILVQDLDGQFLWHYPEDKNLMKKINFALDVLKTTGFDPFVGRKLYWFLYNSGLSNIKVKSESYHLYPGKIDKENYKNWELKLDIILNFLTEAVNKANLQISKNDLLNYFLREDSLTYSVVFTVCGKKRG